MDNDKNSNIEYLGYQVKMEDFKCNHGSINPKPQQTPRQPLNESFKPKHALINPKTPQQPAPKDNTKK
ncbi:hypothetical protein ACOWNM_03360 [Helicobacter pylori]